MSENYIAQRVQELFTYINFLRDSANEDSGKGQEVIRTIKNTSDEDEALELMKGFKKLQFFNNMKLAEMEKTMPTLVELVSIAKVMDIDLGLTEEQELVINTNKKRLNPLYVVDKNQLVFVHKELEEAVDKEINNPSPSDLEALKKIFNVMNKDVK